MAKPDMEDDGGKGEKAKMMFGKMLESKKHHRGGKKGAKKESRRHSKRA
jgi:hypothetical protein